MKRFTIPVDFNGVRSPFHIYIGEAAAPFAPIHFQQAWISQRRSGRVPTEVAESFSKLQTIALEQNLDFEELCAYALSAANQQNAATRQQEAAQPADAPPAPEPPEATA